MTKRITKENFCSDSIIIRLFRIDSDYVCRDLDSRESLNIFRIRIYLIADWKLTRLDNRCTRLSYNKILEVQMYPTYPMYARIVRVLLALHWKLKNRNIFFVLFLQSSCIKRKAFFSKYNNSPEVIKALMKALTTNVSDQFWWNW